MGRRAADLSTPVPVLGVPALVGVRGWRTVGGERAGGVAALTWSHQCSVGVQTSPGTRGLHSQLETEQTDALASQSESRVTKPPNGNVPQDERRVEDGRQDKRDRERGVAGKPWSLLPKAKKGVTFEDLAHETTEDVESKNPRRETHCYARAIKTNLHLSGSVVNGRVNARRDFRYTNGSVVDPEVMGGICSDGGEWAEPGMAWSAQGQEHPRLREHTAVHSGPQKLGLPPGPPPRRVPLRICSHCGGRQAPVTGIACSNVRGLTPPTSAGLNRTRPTQPSPLPSERDLRITASLSPPNTQTNSGPVRQRDPTTTPSTRIYCRTAHLPPHRIIILNNNNKPSLLASPSSTLENEESRLPSLHPQFSTKSDPTPASACVHTDTQRIHSSHTSPHTHTVTVTVTQESAVAMHTNTASYPHKPLTHPHAALTPRPTTLALTPQTNADDSAVTHSGTHPSYNTKPHTQTDTHLKTSTTLRITTQPKRPHTLQPHTNADSNISKTFHAEAHPKITIKAQCNSTDSETTSAPHTYTQSKPTTPSQNHCNTQPKASSTPHKNTQSKPSTTLQHHTNTDPKPSTNSHQPQNISQPRNNTHPKPSTTSHQPQNISQPRNNTHPKPSTTSHQPQNISQNHSNTPPKSSSTLHTDTHSKPEPITGHFTHHNPSNNSNAVTQTKAVTVTHAQTFARSQPRSGTKTEVDSQSQHSNILHTDTNVRSLPVTDQLAYKSSAARRTHTEILAQPVIEHLTPSIGVWTVTDTHTQCKPSTTPASLTQPLIKSYTHTIIGHQFTHQPPTNLRPLVPHNSDNGTHHEDLNIPQTHAHGPLKPSSIEAFLIESNRDSRQNPLLPPSLRARIGLCPLMRTPHVCNPKILKNIQPECSSSSPRPTDSLGPCCALTHSHPANAALLLPTTPQCTGVMDPWRRLRSVETSLQANQEKIGTLLNIIQDLEMSHALSKGRRCFRTGQDLGDCSTCQKTACIVYSVEYDFRRQERRFREVLRFLEGDGDATSSSPPSLPQNHAQPPDDVHTDTRRKSTVKNKKFYRKLLWWLPRKLQRK